MNELKAEGVKRKSFSEMSQNLGTECRTTRRELASFFVFYEKT